jgi:AcrR family transcriptional regulator
MRVGSGWIPKYRVWLRQICLMGSVHKSARERILETADELFYREGIHAVGIDTIIEKSGVAKMSLYRSFASKGRSRLGVLAVEEPALLAVMGRVMARNTNEPRRQLRDLFEAIAARARRPEFRLLKATARGSATAFNLLIRRGVWRSTECVEYVPECRRANTGDDPSSQLLPGQHPTTRSQGGSG